MPFAEPIEISLLLAEAFERLGVDNLFSLLEKAFQDSGLPFSSEPLA